MTWALAAVSLAGTVLTGRKVWWGWLVACASCIAWTTYALATDQPGLAALQGLYVCLTLYNARRWWRERKMDVAPPDEGGAEDERSRHDARPRYHRTRTEGRHRGGPEATRDRS